MNLKITASDLKIIVEDLSKKISHNHMSNITIINSFDIFVSFSNYRKEKLLISLNPAHPFVALTPISNPCGTVMGNLNDVLRKDAKDGYILSVEQLNNDRVLCIHYVYTNDYFDKEHHRLVLELIPHRPNLLILDEQNKILFAKHTTDLSNERPIMKGLQYQPLTNSIELSNDDFDLDRFYKEAGDYYSEAKHKRLEEQFKPVLQHIKSRIKTLKQKIKVLNQEMEKARENFKCQKIGSMFLTYAYDEKELRKYVEDNGLDYDFSQTPGINANKYFQKYKKAKRTIEMDNIELNKTDDEIKYLETCLAQSKYMNEDDIIELSQLLFPHKFKQNSKKKIEGKPGEVVVNDVKILFGKNAKQNDYLTFKKANKTDMFLHIKDEHGSHVIIAHPNPDNEVILTACEIALLLSGKDCGDIQYTKVKDVKKGSFVGQAILTSYQTYVIKEIRNKTRRLLKN